MTKVLIDSGLASMYETMKVAENEPQKQFWSYGEDKPLKSFLGEEGTLIAGADDSDDDDVARDDLDDLDDIEVMNDKRLEELKKKAKEDDDDDDIKMSKEEM